MTAVQTSGLCLQFSSSFVSARRGFPEAFLYFGFLFYFVFYELFFDLSMAAPATTGKDKIDSHLSALCMNAGVSDDQMNRLGDYGVVNVPMFTHLANGVNDTAGLRAFLKSALGGDGPRERRPRSCGEASTGPGADSFRIHGGLHHERD